MFFRAYAPIAQVAMFKKSLAVSFISIPSRDRIPAVRKIISSEIEQKRGSEENASS